MMSLWRHICNRL